VYVLLGQAKNAIHYGELALKTGSEENVPPFCLGYAHEALARAAMLSGEREVRQSHLDKARASLELMQDEQERKMLLADLATIG
jgi:hypothetical protein